ncbi:MAG TPA: aminodeoxychorismate synthase component I [Pseudohongiella sp.]|nr:aminodeoxychorismate synthase component I [Pseudohongiella sp.]
MPELLLQSLPYCRDSRSLMQALAVLPHPVFLDSGLASAAESRYDILSAAPTRFDCMTADVFSRCSELLQDARPSQAELQQLSHLPFCGGLLGCIAYDAGLGIAKIDGSRSGDADVQPLLNLPVAAVGIYDWAVVVDHQQQKTELFILPGCPEKIRQDVLSVMSSVPEETPARFGLVSPFTALDSREHYLAAFRRLQDYILNGHCYQTNLAMAFSAEFSGSTLDAFQLLRQRSRSPFSAYIDAGDFQLLSLSPERFISVRDRQVFTQPIKGTRKRYADPELDQASINDLLSSEKDRAENLMIVDLLRNDLGTLCETGSVKTGSLFALHSFSQVHHLISSISGRLPQHISPLQLLDRCFPGGSITGAPKVRAMQIINELERIPRAFYCGSVFYNDYLDRLDSNICIRTLLANQNHLYCWGGSGVVADSEAELEYQECLDKVSALMDLPGI